jgi:hypothetical protein
MGNSRLFSDEKEAVPEDDPKAVAQHALATLLRLKGTDGEPTLQEIEAIGHALPGPPMTLGNMREAVQST